MEVKAVGIDLKENKQVPSPPVTQQLLADKEVLGGAVRLVVRSCSCLKGFLATGLGSSDEETNQKNIPVPSPAPALPSLVLCSMAETINTPQSTMPLSQSRAGPMPCSSKVCRNLFGPVDHEQIQNDFEELLRQQLEEAQRRWNFNFETETPLEGHFKWERVLLAEQPPREAFSLAKATSGGDKGSSAPHRVPPKDGVGGAHRGAAQQSSELARVGSPQHLKRGQTTVKDFYSSKRRVVHDKPKL
uniref:Cyclin-dependent kinase inhibitor domain-containing protein n=2 Tax=Pavo cristatus TaxID=9049 RepID=A0A8C9LCH4_PAVCR